MKSWRHPISRHKLGAVALVVPLLTLLASTVGANPYVVDIRYAVSGEVSLPNQLANGAVIYNADGEMTIRYTTASEGSEEPVSGLANLMHYRVGTDELDFAFVNPQSGAALLELAGRVWINYDETDGSYDSGTGELAILGISGKTTGLATCISESGLCTIPRLVPGVETVVDDPFEAETAEHPAKIVGDLREDDSFRIKVHSPAIFLNITHVWMWDGEATVLSRTPLTVPEPHAGLSMAVAIGTIALARRRRHQGIAGTRPSIPSR
jgi:hypothetical protein